MAVGDTDLAGTGALLDAYGADMSPDVVEILTRTWTAEDLTNADVLRASAVFESAAPWAPHWPNPV